MAHGYIKVTPDEEKGSCPSSGPHNVTDTLHSGGSSPTTVPRDTGVYTNN